MQPELTNYCSVLLTPVLLSNKQRNTTPIFIKGLWGAKELQTTDLCVEYKIVINNEISKP